MLLLENASIKTKITAIILLTSSLCIFIVLSLFLYINHKDEHQSMIENISVLAKLIGNRSNAALTFNDEQLALDNLASLQTHPSINLACLFDNSGNLFANYIINAQTAKRCPKNVEIRTSATHSIDNNQLLISEPIFMDGEYRGSVYICTSLQVVEENLTRYLLIALLIGLAVGALALLFASRLQIIISKPLTKLTEVARRVSQQKDYSVRATKLGEDEIGALVDSFNTMLSTIETQNADLRKTTERANEANAIKSQFLANMSHELRTPINGVLGMLSLLLSTAQSKEQKEYTQLANQSGNVLLDTVNQILDLASIESVGLTLQPEPVEMNNFLDDLAQLFSAQLATQKLDLTIFVSPSVPKQLSFDTVRVRQIFINLITNAIKFTKKGGVSVKVSWADSRLKVRVEDTGIGIPDDAQERVFESFQQVDNSSTRPFGGTGLGLPISQQICSAMDGSLTLERSTHAGSVFSFDIKVPRIGQQQIVYPLYDFSGVILVLSEASPLGNWFSDVLTGHQIKHQITYNIDDARANLKSSSIVIVDAKFGIDALSDLVTLSTKDNAKDIQQKIVWLTWVGDELPDSLHNRVKTLYKPITATSLSQLFLGSDKHLNHQPKMNNTEQLLIVDDNLINLKAMKSQLENAGFKVDAVENGLQAVQACREKHYELILMDIQMPEMDGLEATNLIQLEQGSHAPTIIGISAHVMEEYIKNAKAAGMADYLCKPVKDDLLIAKVHQYLN